MEVKNGITILDNSLAGSMKATNPAILLSGLDNKNTHIHHKILIRRFMASLFVILPNYKHKCPTTVKWILAYLYSLLQNTITAMINKWLLHTTT